MLDVSFFRGAGCDSDRCLVVTACNTKFDVAKSNFKELNMVEGKEQYQIKISDRLATLGSLMMIWTSIGRERLFSRISEFQPKRV
jgi:hypothetical protein